MAEQTYSDVVEWAFPDDAAHGSRHYDDVQEWREKSG
jgi:hypothetical protein